MDKRPAAGADLVIPMLALGLTVYFLWSVAGVEWQAKANGMIVGTTLLALIAIQVARVGLALARGKADRGFGELFKPRDVLYKRLGMLAITIAFVALVPYVGLAIGLFVALAAALLVMGVRGAKRVIGVALGVAIVSSLLFTVALDSGLPKGPVENLLGRLVR
jgi:hypothetical protein